MAKSFKDLVDKTGNEKTKQIATKRTKELLTWKPFNIIIMPLYLIKRCCERIPKGIFGFFEMWYNGTNLCPRFYIKN